MAANRARRQKKPRKPRVDPWDGEDAPKQASSRRQDPPSRPTDGAAAWAQLRKPAGDDQHYVYVYEGDPEHGPDYYKAIGYHPVEYEKGGVRPMAGKTGNSGDQIEMRGHVLMACSKERRAEIEQFGPDGVSGQALADAIDNRILDDRGGIDHLRGLGGPRGLGVEVATKPVQAER